MVRSMSFSVPAGEKTEKKKISGNPSALKKTNASLFKGAMYFNTMTRKWERTNPFPVVIGMNACRCRVTFESRRNKRKIGRDRESLTRWLSFLYARMTTSSAAKLAPCR